MISFHVYVNGPNILTLIAVANGEALTGAVVNRLYRDGLLGLKAGPSGVEGIEVDTPFLTERGRAVLGLIDHDVQQYLSRLHAKKAKKKN